MIKSISEKAKSFPETPGVYRFFGNKKILYIGKAKNLRKRVQSYFRSSVKEYKTNKLVERIEDIDFLTTNNETEALLLEQNLIKSNQPQFNILLRDDKSFPYIKIDEKHDFPSITFKRTTKAEKNLFGPFISAKGTRTAITELQKILKLRTCNDVFFANRSRPCLQYQIKKCSAPCVGFISKADYKKDIETSKSILKGNFKQILAHLDDEMRHLSDKEEFEKAGEVKNKIRILKRVEESQIIFSGGEQTKVVAMAAFGIDVCFVVIDIERNSFTNIRRFSFKNKIAKSDSALMEEFISRLVLANPQIKEIVCSDESFHSPFFPNINFTFPTSGKKKNWIEMANRNARNLLSLRLQRSDKYSHSVDYLQKNFGINKESLSIVGFDVSGGVGDIQTVSCVYFNYDGPVKSKYRFYHVPLKDSKSDLSALLFGIRKYLQNNFDISLVLIDGGLNHLKFIEGALKKKKYKFASIGKGEKRKYGIENLFYGENKVEFRKDDSMSKIFLDVRDEAHRFAIKNFRSTKRKNLTQHFLQDIPGIGPKTISKIYKEYQSLEELSKQSNSSASKKLNLNVAKVKKIQDCLKEMYN
ncbi:MAG: excinuclease ABC subunit UvrC [Pseudomonadota bacterium]|nr:excinuclease ABC subunit UvrC [Pseudomonadota bacterium]